MGMYDEVRVACPKCGTYRHFQSKGGNCDGRLYDLENVPPAVLSNVNRHSPAQCAQCGSWFAVDERTRLSILTDPQPPDYTFTNDWYRRHHGHS